MHNMQLDLDYAGLDLGSGTGQTDGEGTGETDGETLVIGALCPASALWGHNSNTTDESTECEACQE